ncbi:hypothetical protein PILCRDRAFT_3335 [Piloderma croceum F 1598]|uniref:Major facilitator superfamily (MFS) profile domain-containing protein n=1 Tax=Piloderma croceum (strain F 1598) TaxID=765440 RepID=A0A0C3BPA4_PILCF|nr:hypothetical protein PILCRDRAFT_3335 [Piloderma croceum F 1598]
MSIHSTDKDGVEKNFDQLVSEIDLLSFHELHAGRLVVDPGEAKIEFGETVASKLKLTSDGTKVLWPQPTDDPEDPQNWSDRRKTVQLIVVTLAAFVPDFDSGIGIAGIFALAKEYDTTTGVINNLTSNWSIFLIGTITDNAAPIRTFTQWWAGFGGLFAVMLMRKFGRLPVLFWSQLLALALLIGATFSPTLRTFAAFRCLTAFFGSCPQVTGLYVVTDIYPFHLQARKLNLWMMGNLLSPFVSPFAFGFLVARTTWRWAYGIGSLYGLVVVFLITLFMEETMYDRTVKPIPQRPSTGIRYRVESLIGITGAEMAKYRSSWHEIILSPFNIVWRPHLLGAVIFEGMLFGFGIGVNVTQAVFLGSPPPVGFGLTPFAVSGLYGTPIIATLIGELIGRYLNDWIMDVSIRRNKGVHEAESRLWACYLAVVLYVSGFVVLGAAFQQKLSIGAVIMGWGISVVAIMINTVAIYAYSNDCFPKRQGEISALVNLGRILGGFSVAYFQVPWATKYGALQTLGVEAAIVVGLFFLVIPVLQLKGRYLRECYSL